MVKVVKKGHEISYVLSCQDGSDVILSWSEAREIYDAMDTEYRKDDLRQRLEMCKSVDGTYVIGYHTNAVLNDEDIEKLVEASLEVFELELGEDEAWNECADRALAQTFEEMRR